MMYSHMDVQHLKNLKKLKDISCYDYVHFSKWMEVPAICST